MFWTEGNRNKIGWGRKGSGGGGEFYRRRKAERWEEGAIED